MHLERREGKKDENNRAGIVEAGAMKEREDRNFRQYCERKSLQITVGAPTERTVLFFIT
jgi:hypothetical protein